MKKKNIIVTQRSDFVEERDEWRDSLDQNFASLFGSSLNIIPIPNTLPNPQAFAMDVECKGIILSGGGAFDQNYRLSCPQRMETESQLLQYAKKCQIVVLGICYGMQLLNLYFGGGITKSHTNHVNVKHNVIFGKKLKISTNSYHGFAIYKESVSDAFEVLGVGADGSIECFLHRFLPWLGLMWHPERELAFNGSLIELIVDIFSAECSSKNSLSIKRKVVSWYEQNGD